MIGDETHVRNLQRDAYMHEQIDDAWEIKSDFEISGETKLFFSLDCFECPRSPNKVE